MTSVFSNERECALIMVNIFTIFFSVNGKTHTDLREWFEVGYNSRVYYERVVNQCWIFTTGHIMTRP